VNKQIRLIPALALGMAVLSIPPLATAATTITIVDSAPLLARGAGARVSVEVTCDLAPNPSVFVFTDLTQRVGNRTTSGSGSTNSRIPITCDNTPQIVDVIVSSFGGRVFKKGPAIARAFADVCTSDFFVCESSTVTDEIQLVQQ
jgi:hypothetical protein